MINATRKAGFLIEDGHMLGSSIVILRDEAFKLRKVDIGASARLSRIAAWLDDLQVGVYYEPVQQELITEEIEEVA